MWYVHVYTCKCTCTCIICTYMCFYTNTVHAVRTCTFQILPEAIHHLPQVPVFLSFYLKSSSTCTCIYIFNEFPMYTTTVHVVCTCIYSIPPRINIKSGGMHQSYIMFGQ